MRKTITKEYLSNCIKKEMGLPRSESLKLVALILDNSLNKINRFSFFYLVDII